MRAVIFDMDGVIFDTERLLIECWLEAGRGRLPLLREVCLECLGLDDRDTKSRMLREYGDDFPYDAYERKVLGLFKEKTKGWRMPVKEGTREILSFLKENGIKIALATSSPKKAVEKELEAAQLMPYFDRVICGDMVKAAKPDPEIYIKACEALSVKPGEAFAVEDSYNGIRSASDAGVPVIMVPDLAKPTEETDGLVISTLPSLCYLRDYFDKLIQGGGGRDQ